jgi:hypothetical protein
VLNYVVECSEGMNSNMGKDDWLRLLIPEMNMDRLVSSGARPTLHELDKVRLSALNGS